MPQFKGGNKVHGFQFSLILLKQPEQKIARRNKHIGDLAKGSRN